jgi:hypothetical protein
VIDVAACNTKHARVNSSTKVSHFKLSTDYTSGERLSRFTDFAYHRHHGSPRIGPMVPRASPTARSTFMRRDIPVQVRPRHSISRPGTSPVLYSGTS